MAWRVVLYDGAFFEYVICSTLRSARGVLPLPHQVLEIHSVLEFGYGHSDRLAARAV
jgi:hypothetical protein